jgi:hypothetical protein
MRISEFFKRNEKSKIGMVEVPEELKHLISPDDFNSILTYAITHLKDQGHSDIAFADGLLIYDNLGEVNMRSQTNFLNLVKSVICEAQKDWQIKTVEYLDNLNKDKELESEILLNFERAKEYLTLRLQPFSTYEDEPLKSHIETLVYKIDIPETFSLLALDLPNRFHILTADEINIWHKEKTELFQIAHTNLIDKIEIIQAQQHNWDDAVFYTLFDRDYSAAYCIDFAINCSNLIGEKGSLVSFPTRGSVFIHPISNSEQFNIGYKHLVEKTNKFFDDDPGPISRNVYWFHEKKFTLFRMIWNNGEIAYKIPQKLHDILNK